MTQRRRRVTALDVAREAGVSKTTVSYVLNDTPHQTIPAETRDRVLAAVRTLNYTPSSLARALRKGRSDVVLLVLPDWPLGRVVSRIIDAMTAELDKSGLSLMTRREREGEPLAALWQETAPAAVVAFHVIAEEDRQALSDAGVYAATAILAEEESTDEAVDLPQETIGVLQVRHLAANGHDIIGYASVRDPRVRTFRDLRLRGVRRACAELGLEEPVVIDLDAELDPAIDAVRMWRGSAKPVTGIAAYNDELAAAVLAAMRALDLSAPTDLAVIGVDDEPLARFACPPLSTVKQDEVMIAAHLAHGIVEGIAGRPTRPLGSEAISLVVRESA
ncbi:LacI family DNA-binding transcriptional regulator [Rathayibacter sp. VKM Ac-2857]|uniref:LacI family DNA-binding transcriptional regulator n=1 Tax=Rathayibacter sp. VKM Ac-2857 TaxID=2739020 RepID=UPI001567268A|nr:LacI family DNA-binding transcriptional regulator [Rathayibacter sp. VKM Ac-2857]NQX17342.1 LacI family DNA-binding transcriptional regulator [Rathayibacter sp. VKM Ac-2857]